MTRYGQMEDKGTFWGDLFMGGGLGLFGGEREQPQLVVPDLPERESSEDIMRRMQEYLSGEVSPLGFDARESALRDLGRGNEYYEEFQPTSMEQALAQKEFDWLSQQIQRDVGHNLSMSGTADSPILAEQIAKAQTQMGIPIAQYLSQLGNTRAQYSLGSRMGINPVNELLGISSPALMEAEQQQNLQWEQAQMQALADAGIAMSGYAGGGESQIGNILGDYFANTGQNQQPTTPQFGGSQGGYSQPFNDYSSAYNPSSYGDIRQGYGGNNALTSSFLTNNAANQNYSVPKFDIGSVFNKQ